MKALANKHPVFIYEKEKKDKIYCTELMVPLTLVPHFVIRTNTFVDIKLYKKDNSLHSMCVAY